MVNSIAALLAVAAVGATASALSAGQAQVKNKCNYDVYLCNVPAEGGGQQQEDKTLSPGDSWSQTWTELSNGQGWSIKLSNSTSLESILQYEYTFHNDGTIWFDLSCVNGDPWPENWVMTGNNGCDPKQTAYRYPTDDDYGMQACAQDASVLVTLCETDADDTSISSSPASAPAYTSAESSSSSSVYSAPAYSTTSTTAEAPAYTPASSSASAPHYSHTGGWGWFSDSNGVVEAAEDYTAPASVTPTTLATSVVASKADDGADVTVVEVVTAVDTAVVTAYGRHRRHEHHPAHQHHA